jgi:hypothetical protein
LERFALFFEVFEGSHDTDGALEFKCFFFFLGVCNAKVKCEGMKLKCEMILEKCDACKHIFLPTKNWFKRLTHVITHAREHYQHRNYPQHFQ